MTDISVTIVGGVPLVRLTGEVTERDGAALAAAIMSAIWGPTTCDTTLMTPMHPTASMGRVTASSPE